MQKEFVEGVISPRKQKSCGAIFFWHFWQGCCFWQWGRGFSAEKRETPAQAETQTASDVAERETETRMAEILSKVQGQVQWMSC